MTAGFQPQASFASPNNGLAPAFVLGTGFPQTGSLQPTQTPTLLNGQGGSFYDANAGKLPRLQEWTFGVQQALGKHSTMQVDYVGNRGDRLIDANMVNINQVDPKYLSLGSLLTQSATSSAAVTAGIKLPYTGFTGTVAQALRPFPQYLTLTSQAAKAGISNYNAIQVVVTHRTGFGLTLNANYTYSKSLGIQQPKHLRRRCHK